VSYYPKNPFISAPRLSFAGILLMSAVALTGLGGGIANSAALPTAHAAKIMAPATLLYRG
jgi:hypothetical protein